MSVCGKLRAEFALGRSGTILVSGYHQYPQKLLKCFAMPGGQAAACVMDASPGLLAGDEHELSFLVRKEAKVFITTQSFGKIHPSPHRRSTQRVVIEAEDDTLTEYIPEPVIPYAESCFEGGLELKLASRAAAVVGEIICPGREHRGELFRYKRYVSYLRVFRADKLVYGNRIRLEPESHGFHSAATWGSPEYPYSGSLHLFGPYVPDSLLTELQEAAERLMQAAAGIRVGVSRTEAGISTLCLSETLALARQWQDKSRNVIRERAFALPYVGRFADSMNESRTSASMS